MGQLLQANMRQITHDSHSYALLSHILADILAHMMHFSGTLATIAHVMLIFSSKNYASCNFYKPLIKFQMQPLIGSILFDSHPKCKPIIAPPILKVFFKNPRNFHGKT